MSRERVHIISPTIECISLASLCRTEWDEIRPAGSTLITSVLTDLSSREEGPARILISLHLVIKPDLVRQSLRILSEKGTPITWLATTRSQSVVEACRGLQNVELVLGQTVTEAFTTYWPRYSDATLLEDLRSENRALTEYLRYKTALFLINLDPQMADCAIEDFEQLKALVAPDEGDEGNAE